jgi:transmembrane sensor
MNERLDSARQLNQRIDAGWQREDVEAQLARLHARQRSRARRRAIAVPLAAVAITVAIFAGLPRDPAPPPVVAAPEVGEVIREVIVERPRSPAEPAPVVTPPLAPVIEGPALPPGALSLGDGSVVTPLAKDSRLLARKVSDTDVVVALTGGGARFDVPDREGRRFRADLGTLALDTHGAAFRVQITRRQIEVAAERGEVSARWGREHRVVAAGETRAFSIAAREEASHIDRDDPPAAAEPPVSWRDAAGRGDYAAAWIALPRLAAPLDAMEDLLLAGDVARLSGHADAAVAQLSRAIAIHADDPRAPLAAFTLGRVHLEDLGAPRDAAQAFARARALAPSGPLAEDALAREVEAWSRAGETATARARALDYTRRYPQGHRSHAVRQFGGLEGP